MKRIQKKVMAFGVGLLFFNTTFAQQGTILDGKSFFQKNVYVSAGIGNQWLTQGYYKGKTVSGKISVGSWFNNYSGIRLYGGVGVRKMNLLNSTGAYTIGVDYMLNMLPLFGEYNASSPLSFILGAGGAFNKLNWGNKKEPSFNMSLQLGYDFTSRWGVFTEFSGDVMKKFYAESGKGGSISCAISVGLRYRLSKHAYKSGNSTFATLHEVSSADKEKIRMLEQNVSRLNTEINELRKSLNARQAIEPADKDVMVAPKEVGPSIDIFFDKFSSFINDNQLQKINAVGKWMKNNTFEIRIAAFSDNLTDSDTDEKLRKSRTDAIRNLLITNYGIKPERISVVRAEDLGYKNLTGCNAKIIFLEKQK